MTATPLFLSALIDHHHFFPTHSTPEFGCVAGLLALPTVKTGAKAVETLKKERKFSSSSEAQSGIWGNVDIATMTVYGDEMKVLLH